MMARTLAGLCIFSVGINPRSAAISGVPVRKVVIGTFILCGMFAAIAAIIYSLSCPSLLRWAARQTNLPQPFRGNW